MDSDLCYLFLSITIPHKRAFQKEELTMPKARVGYMTGKQAFADGCMTGKQAWTVLPSVSRGGWRYEPREAVGDGGGKLAGGVCILLSG